MNFAKKMLLVNEDYINMVKKYGVPQSNDSTSTTAITDTLDTSDQMIAMTIPKTLRGKAETLIKYLRANGVTYDETHCLIIDDKPIEGANYADLINDLVRYRESLPPPRGFENLAPVLKRLNVSRELVTNMKRYNDIMALSTSQLPPKPQRRRRTITRAETPLRKDLGSSSEPQKSDQTQKVPRLAPDRHRRASVRVYRKPADKWLRW